MEDRCVPATITVSNTNDSGIGSLRQAILDANNIANVGGPDTILFAIPSTDANHRYYQNDGVPGQITLANIQTTVATDDTTIANIDPDYAHSWWSIKPNSALPMITDRVIIDGYSQGTATLQAATPNTNGPLLGINAVLRIELDGSSPANPAAVGLAINTGNSTLGSGSTVRGLVINGFVSDTDPYGDAGIFLSGGGGNVIVGNFIGTDVSGTRTPIGPVDMNSDFAPTGGMHLGISSIGSVGNRIGTDGNGFEDPAERNLISGTTAGVGLTSFNGEGGNNIVAGNFIGTDRSGTKSGAIGNWMGISLNGSQGDRIGTDGNGVNDSMERNIISGNKFGIGPGGVIPSFLNTQITGNFIGTDVTGTQDLGNLLTGVAVAIGASNTTIRNNTIAFNDGPGVWILDFLANSTGNRVQRNSIHSNGGLGIDLGGEFPSPGPNGVTLNDLGDFDTGPNYFQNYPVITAALFTPQTTIVTGTLNSTANATFTLDFYTDSDPSGTGEGKYYLGSTNVTTNANGNATFTNLSLTNAVIPSEVIRVITATATDALGNTSEFSAAFSIDIDGDGIANIVDTQPTSFSNDFSDGNTFGSITNRGNGSIIVTDSPDPAKGIRIVTNSAANFSVPGATLSVISPTEFEVTHGSVILGVLEGTVDATFIGDNGKLATTTLVAGNELTFQPETFTFIAPSTNTQIVTVLTEGNHLNVGPGQTVKSVQIDIKPGDGTNTLNLTNNGKISVAILSTTGFDAHTVNINSIVFAGAHVESYSFEDVNGDGLLDLVVKFRTQDTNLRSLYEQLVADDINEDGILDSNHQTASIALSGLCQDGTGIFGVDSMDLFLSGKALRDLLAELVASGAI